MSLLGLITESTSPFENFSPTSAFHASPKTAFTKLFDLAFAMVFHIILLSIKDYNYESPLAMISLISIGPVIG
jgi:hypothetical protein